MESIQEKLFPSNRFKLVALSPDAKEERRTVQLIRGTTLGSSLPLGTAPPQRPHARTNSPMQTDGAWVSQFDFDPLFAQLDREFGQRRVEIIAHLAVLFAVDRYGAFAQFAVGFASG